VYTFQYLNIIVVNEQGLQLFFVAKHWSFDIMDTSCEVQDYILSSHTSPHSKNKLFRQLQVLKGR